MGHDHDQRFLVWKRCRKTERGAALIFATALLTSVGAGAQPQSGGALESLDIEPKTLALKHDFQFESACALDAASLERGLGCEGARRCSDSSVASCDLPGGLDHVAAGAGLRNSGRGTITLRGAPERAVPVAAWLYWGVITTKPDDLVMHEIRFRKVGLQGTRVGVTKEPCWSKDAVFAAYRVAVTELIDPGINGDYSVELEVSATKTGLDPWQTNPEQVPLVDGASLVVVYAHADVPRAATFYLHHGAHYLAGQLTLRHRLDPPLPDARELRHTRIGGDGQLRAGIHTVAPFQTWLFINDVPRAIRGPGSPIDRHSDWQGGDGGATTQLWDTSITLVPLQEVFVSGLNRYELVYETLKPAGDRAYYDCVAVVAHAMTAR